MTPLAHAQTAQVEVCVQSIPSAWGSCSGTAMAAMLWQLRRLFDPISAMPTSTNTAAGTSSQASHSAAEGSWTAAAAALLIC